MRKRMKLDSIIQILKQKQNKVLDGTKCSETYHKLTLGELERNFSTSVQNGMDSVNASQTLLKYGKNKIKQKRPNPIFKLIGYFFSGFCGLLWISAIICILAWEPIGDPPDPIDLALGILLIIVIILQASFSAFQDWSSGRVMKSIKKMMPSTASVIRNGVEHKIHVEEIVVGDLVILNNGSKVPADLRIIESHDLKFDKSMLTGESEAIEGTIECTDERYLESKNIAFMTTLITNGHGKGIVVATGGQTMMGKIAALTSQTNNKSSSLQRELKRLVMIVGTAAIIIAIVVVIAWATWLRVEYPNYISTSEFLVNTISVMIAFIPEGLPICVTLFLLVIAKRLAKSQVLVKNLGVIETLSCVNVIASDKTGTLTQNKMFVASVATGDHKVDMEDLDKSERSIALEQLITTCSLCNNAHFEEDDEKKPVNQRNANGDATDIALLRFSSQYEQRHKLDDNYTLLADIPFNSRNKWMVKVVRPKDREVHQTIFGNEQDLVLIKGAPDYLLKKTSFILQPDGTQIPLTDEIVNKIVNIQNEWCLLGQRVLVLCKKNITFSFQREHFDLESYIHSSNDFCLIGLVGIIDPPREGISDVITKCKEAGIRVIMLTGDYALTAASIAIQIGIFSELEYDTRETMGLDKSNRQALLLTGTDLETMNDDDWKSVICYKEIVFARTTPDQKLKTVKEFQKEKFVVAVTGDGVNDAPALKSADVGIAMGGGSEVAMEASQLVLLDNNFESILTAIRNGRLVFYNLRKVVLFILPGGVFVELVPVLVSMFLGVPQNISSFQMLMISLFTDIAPSLSLTMEREETDLLKQPPRSRKDHLVNWKLLIQAYLILGVMIVIGSQVMFFVYMQTFSGLTPENILFAFDRLPEIYNSTLKDGGIEMAKTVVDEFYYRGQTVTFVSIILLQIFGNLMSTRTSTNSFFKQAPWAKKTRNLYLFGAQLISCSIMLIVVYVPLFNTTFNTRPLPVQFLFLPLLFSLGIFALDELRKLLSRKKLLFFHKFAW